MNINSNQILFNILEIGWDKQLRCLISNHLISVVPDV
jgi:hypothetical protein